MGACNAQEGQTITAKKSLPSDVSISSTGSLDTAGFEGGLDPGRSFNAYWEYQGQRMPMNINTQPR